MWITYNIYWYFSEHRINKRKYEIEKSYPNEEDVENIFMIQNQDQNYHQLKWNVI